MRSLFVSTLLVSFIGFAVFGVLSMHADMQNHDGGCVVTTTQGKDCPKQSSPLEYLTFHLEVFKDFSNATFAENIIISLLTIILSVIGVGLGALLKNLTPLHLSPAYSRYRHFEFFSSSPKQRLLRWLAFHENSPATL